MALSPEVPSKQRAGAAFRVVLRALYVAGLAALAFFLVTGAGYYLTPVAERARHPLYWTLKPGGTLGLKFGVAGLLMMTVMHLYSARKRLRALRRLGALRRWLDLHILLGILGPLFVVLHSSFKIGGLVSISFWSMVAVALSGVFGRYLYLQIPRTRAGEELSLAEAEKADRELAQRCGACVKACPEGDVLGIVGGTAAVINGLRCVGHARCQDACPVGAIAVGLGDLRSRADMPQVDEWNETDTPGLFLAGEVRGLALVRNAVTQGRRVVERIAQRHRGTSPGGDVVDVLVVGAGPAGLTAALACTERGLTHRVLEQEPDLGGSLLHYPRRKMVLLQPVDLPLHGRIDREEYQKEHFLELMEGLVGQHALDVRFGQKARGVRRREDGVFEVESTTGAVHRARFVILALGRRGTPRKLGVPGEDLPKVMYRLMDAESYRGQKVLVVGGGDSAVEAAVGLAQQPGNEVILSYRRDKLVRIKKKNEDRLAPLLASGRIRPLFSSHVTAVTPGTVRIKVGADVQEIANDYVFVFAGGEPPFEFLKKAGVRFGGEAAQAAVS